MGGALAVSCEPAVEKLLICEPICEEFQISGDKSSLLFSDVVEELLSY